MALLRLRFRTMYPPDLARAIDRSGGMSMGVVEMQPTVFRTRTILCDAGQQQR